MSHNYVGKISNITNIVLILLFIATITTLVSFNYFTSCIKYVVWNEVIFLSLLYYFSISIFLFIIKEIKNLRILKEINISKYSIYFCIGISLNIFSSVMIILNINKLINC